MLAFKGSASPWETRAASSKPSHRERQSADDSSAIAQCYSKVLSAECCSLHTK
ncbi:MAG: hypothetical protein F6K32_06915 [Desertifilum sp. SIO1I2]|nr:hypothetical protein [Desertifilum sp. SIO1I2]